MVKGTAEGLACVPNENRDSRGNVLSVTLDNREGQGVRVRFEEPLEFSIESIIVLFSAPEFESFAPFLRL